MTSQLKEDLSVEFAKLAEAHENLSTEKALEQTKHGKNRYRDIMPYDNNLVKLNRTEIFPEDYINASFINGFTRQKEYIATQGPLIATIDDFWRMIWDYNCRSIVMLANLIESGERKCEKYWPDFDCVILVGEMKIMISTEEHRGEWMVRQLKLEKKKEVRCIFQFQFIDWPDYGIPKKNKNFFEFTREVRIHLDQFPFFTGPTVVHCSAGVGRTGTFIAMDCILQMFKANPSGVDIFNLVYGLRKQRMHLVQTKEQYFVLHQILEELVVSSKAAAEDSRRWLDQTNYENINTI